MQSRGFQQIYSDQIRLTLILLFSTDLSRLTQIKVVGIIMRRAAKRRGAAGEAASRAAKRRGELPKHVSMLRFIEFLIEFDQLNFFSGGNKREMLSTLMVHRFSSVKPRVSEHGY